MKEEISLTAVAHVWIATAFALVGVSPAAAQSSQDSVMVLAAAVSAALTHVESVTPDGTVAMDTSTARGGRLSEKAAVTLGMQQTSLSAITGCSKSEVRCSLLSGSPAVVIAQQRVNDHPAVTILGHSAIVTVILTWEQGVDASKRIEDPVIQVRLTKRDGRWVAVSTTTLFH